MGRSAIVVVPGIVAASAIVVVSACDAFGSDAATSASDGGAADTGAADGGDHDESDGSVDPNVLLDDDFEATAVGAICDKWNPSAGVARVASNAAGNGTHFCHWCPGTSTFTTLTRSILVGNAGTYVVLLTTRGDATDDAGGCRVSEKVYDPGSGPGQGLGIDGPKGCAEDENAFTAVLLAGHVDAGARVEIEISDVSLNCIDFDEVRITYAAD